MLAAFGSPAGETVLRRAEETVRALAGATLATGSMGGMQIWFDVALLGPTGVFALNGFAMGSATWEMYELPHNYEAIVKQMRARSARTGLSCREAAEMGDEPLDGETSREGNVVVDLTPGGTYKLIVSAIGLTDPHTEELCDLLARAVKVQVPGLLHKLAPEIRDEETIPA